jgi:hypothetical protein
MTVPVKRSGDHPFLMLRTIFSSARFVIFTGELSRPEQTGPRVDVGLHRYSLYAMPLTCFIFAFIKSLGVRDAFLRLSRHQ